MKVPYANHVDFHARLEVCSPHVPVKYNITVTCPVCIHLVRVRYILVPIDENVGVSVPPNQRSVLRQEKG